MGIEPIIADLGDILGWLLVAGLVLVGLQFVLGIGSWIIMLILGGGMWLWEGIQKGKPGAIAVLVGVVGLGGWWIGSSGDGSQPTAQRSSLAQKEWLSHSSIDDSVQERLRPIYLDYLRRIQETEAGANWLASTEPKNVILHAPILAMAGLQRHNDSTVLRAVKILAAAANRADSTRCTQVLMGGRDRGWELQTMAVLDSPRVAKWYDITDDAVVAELRESPPAIKPDSTEIQVAIRHFFSSMSTADRLRFLSLIRRDADEHSEVDQCWIIRKTVNEVLELEEPYRTTLARRIFSTDWWLCSSPAFADGSALGIQAASWRFCS